MLPDLTEIAFVVSNVRSPLLETLVKQHLRVPIVSYRVAKAFKPATKRKALAIDQRGNDFVSVSMAKFVAMAADGSLARFKALAVVPMPIHLDLTEEQVAEFGKFPGAYETGERKSHPLAKLERDGALQQALNMAPGYRIGVGSSTAQKLYFNHNFCPIRSTDDVAHEVSAKHGCPHKFGDCCECWHADFKASGHTTLYFVGVHSFYYISAGEILAEVRAASARLGVPPLQTRILMAVNDYPTWNGSIGQSSYLLKNGQVEQRCGGDCDGYVHDLGFMKYLKSKINVYDFDLTNFLWKWVALGAAAKTAMWFAKFSQKTATAAVTVAAAAAEAAKTTVQSTHIVDFFDKSDYWFVRSTIASEILPLPPQRLASRVPIIGAVIGAFVVGSVALALYSVRKCSLVMKHNNVSSTGVTKVISVRPVPLSRRYVGLLGPLLWKELPVSNVALQVGNLGDVSFTYECAGLQRHVTVPRKLHAKLLTTGALVKNRLVMGQRIVKVYADEKAGDIPDEAIDVMADHYHSPSYTANMTSTVSFKPLGPIQGTIRTTVLDYRVKMRQLIYYGLSKTIPNHVPGYFSNCLETEEIGMHNRVLKKRLPADAALWAQIRDWCIDTFPFRNVNGGEDLGPIVYLEPDEYIGQLKGRKAVLAQEISDEIDCGITNVDNWQPTYGAFIKGEFNKTQEDAMNGDPRIIQGPDPVTKFLAGRFCRPASKRVSQVWNMYNSITYASGMTHAQVGEWCDIGLEAFGPLAIGLEIDYSRWDASMSPEALECSYAWFESMGCPREVLDILHNSVKTKGYTKNGFAYLLWGGRHSGDADTSVGNSLLNGGANGYYFTFIQPTEFRMIVLGDDNYIMFPPGFKFDKEQYTEFMTRLGLKPVFVEHESAEQGSFCSQHFYPATKVCDDGSRQQVHVLGADLKRTLTKYAWGTDLTPKDTRGWLKGQALSRLPQNEAVPVLRILLEQAIRLDVRATEDDSFHCFTREVVVQNGRMPGKYICNEQTNAFMVAKYGIAIVDLEALFHRAEQRKNSGTDAILDYLNSIQED